MSELEYQEKYENILKNYDHNKFLFEMTKCCGYGFIQPIFKMNTLDEIYRNLQLEMSHITICGIYLKDCNENRLDIPRDEMITVESFFYANRNWFVPIYPLPTKVVYRLYYDDDHFHTHDNNENLQTENNNCIVDNNIEIDNEKQIR